MKIGIQMFSLRNYIEKENIEKAFDEIEECGFDCIEPIYHDYGLGLENVGKLMRKHNLSAISAHIPAEILTQKDELKKMRDIFELETAVIPSLSREIFYDNNKLSAVLFPILHNADKLGLKVAYHNHNFEFKQPDALSDMPKKFPPLKLQPDVFWLKASGICPVEFLNKNKANIELIHLKEFGDDAKDFNPVVGSGTTDAENIIKFAVEQKHIGLILEFENPRSDEITYMRDSLKYIKEVVKKYENA